MLYLFQRDTHAVFHKCVQHVYTFKARHAQFQREGLPGIDVQSGTGRRAIQVRARLAVELSAAAMTEKCFHGG